MFDVLTKPNLKELQHLQLFQSVSPEVIEEIIESCVIRRLKKKEVLLLPEQPNHYLYQLMSGRLRVHLHSLTNDPVCYLEPGEVVGELSIIDNSLTSAFVVAEEDCRLLVMEETEVWSIVEASHIFARNLLKGLSKRLRQANEVIAEKMQVEDFFYHYGTIDVLTGMHNRAWLDRILPRALKRFSISGKPLTVILLDIDNFRAFSEKHGRLSGDMALNKVARTVMEHVRATEIAVRYAGDRLLVLLPDTDCQQARVVAERLRQKVMYIDLMAPDGRILPSLTISLGIAQAGAEQTVEELLEAAGIALERAKEMGRNFVSD
jgi:diguanylate cyclase (GGDEF)-like protein